MKQLCILLSLLLGLTGCAAGEAAQNHQITYRGVPIAIDAEAAPILAALATPDSYTEEASCAFEGMDKTYGYGSLYLATYPTDGVERIARIWFSGEGPATGEGISIGSSRADLQQAYGPWEGGDIFTQVQNSSKLTILLTDDRVTSIQYALILS